MTLATYFSVSQANYVKEFGHTTQKMDFWLLELIQLLLLMVLGVKSH